MKKIATIVLTCIIGFSMTLAPTLMAERAYAEEEQEQTEAVEEATEAAVEELNEEAVAAEQEEEITAAEAETEETTVPEEPGVAEGSALEGLAGKNISDIENDPELSFVLEDPTFYRYYEVDENGLISEKKVEPDEVDEFLANADANADGIDVFDVRQ